MHTRVCKVCKKTVPMVNFWTDDACKYCWQKQGKSIYRYDYAPFKNEKTQIPETLFADSPEST